MTAWWLAFRYFGSWRRFFTLTTSLSIIGMAIGVASLVVSMAVFSGYVSTLEETVQDAVGHVLVLKRGAADQQEMLKDIKPMIEGLIGETPFVYAEAILAHKGKISGVLVEGVDQATVENVLSLKKRVISGELSFVRDSDQLPRVLIGKGIAQKYELNVGDTLNLVVPLATDYQAASFRPKLRKFKISGVIDYGRYDFDSRYVVMSLPEAQDFVELGKRITGYRLKIANPYAARGIVDQITNKFGGTYWARDWLEVNRNLFEAARLEKVVLFFVLMILVVAAAFNIANTLFISVVQRYRDISILKTLGAPNKMIRRIFTCQGLIVGAVGAFSGVLIGLAVCELLEFAIVQWKLIPAEIYKLDRITLDIQGLDLLYIVLISMVICFLATLVPSRRSAKISPIEGLRYE